MPPDLTRRLRRSEERLALVERQQRLAALSIGALILADIAFRLLVSTLS